MANELTMQIMVLLRKVDHTDEYVHQLLSELEVYYLKMLDGIYSKKDIEILIGIIQNYEGDISTEIMNSIKEVINGSRISK